MSAVSPIATEFCGAAKRRYVPEADIAPAARSKIKRPPTEAAYPAMALRTSIANNTLDKAHPNI
jgi:hypothetical protein